MWLVFWAFFGTSGAGLMWKNSIGSIATSFGMADRIGGFVFFVCVCVFVGEDVCCFFLI